MRAGLRQSKQIIKIIRFVNNTESMVGMYSHRLSYRWIIKELIKTINLRKF